MFRRFLQMVEFIIGLNPCVVLIKSSAPIGKYQVNDWGNKFYEDSEGWGQRLLREPFTRTETISFVNLNAQHDVKIKDMFINIASFFPAYLVYDLVW